VVVVEDSTLTRQTVQLEEPEVEDKVEELITLPRMALLILEEAEEVLA
jgi:hypothetical protein